MKKLLLLLLMMLATVQANATSSLRSNIPQNRELQNLEGTITIDIDYNYINNGFITFPPVGMDVVKT